MLVIAGRPGRAFCGLTIAAQLDEARPGSPALQLCTLAFRLDDFKVANLVATALSGDGAAACLFQPRTACGEDLNRVVIGGISVGLVRNANLIEDHR